jgi:hypothetical protein
MPENTNNGASRREFLSGATRVATVSALAGVALPHVHAAENNTLQVALVGCGGRGTGAAVNALSVTNGPMKLVAMAGRSSGPALPRLRRLSPGDGCNEAG